jgi:hypothetical protein
MVPRTPFDRLENKLRVSLKRTKNDAHQLRDDIRANAIASEVRVDYS